MVNYRLNIQSVAYPGFCLTAPNQTPSTTEPVIPTFQPCTPSNVYQWFQLPSLLSTTVNIPISGTASGVQQYIQTVFNDPLMINKLSASFDNVFGGSNAINNYGSGSGSTSFLSTVSGGSSNAATVKIMFVYTTTNMGMTEDIPLEMLKR